MFEVYDKKIKQLINSKSKETSWADVLSTHREMISLIQHERLIHLLVMIFVGIVMAMSCFATILSSAPSLIILDLPLMVLFIAYIFHYRFLENTTQAWYTYIEKIKEKIN